MDSNSEKCINFDSPCFRSLRIALIYALFSVLWILFSDKILLSLTHDIELLTRLQTLKGWCFVLLSAGIIFVLLHREIRGLREAEDKFQAIFDHHYQFTGLLTPEGILVTANKAALNFVGTREEDAIGKFFWDTPWWAHSAELQEQVKSEFSKAAKGEFVRFETTHPGPNGEIHYVDFSFNPVANENGEIIYLVPEGRDITYIKEAEGRLLFTQHTVDHSSRPILWLGKDRKILYANQAACNLFDYSMKEFLNQKEEILHPEGISEYWEKYIPQLQDNRTVSEEIQLRKKNGTVFTALFNLSYLEYMGQGKFVVHITDLTKSKQTEEELRQAQKMEALGTLAGGVAHDFNNILSAIFGYADLATMDVDNRNNLLKDIKEVKKAAHRAKDLVAQILTFSRKKELQKQPIRASIIIEEALKLLRSSIPSTIEIQQADLSDSVIEADPTQFHQIVMNLCTNAYHAMRETGGILRVELQDTVIPQGRMGYSHDVEIKPGRYLELEVCDSGIGMDEKTRSKIFDPYFTTKGKGEGTGLGLAVVHGIVKDYGGHIIVESEPGHGTSFSLYFPLSERNSYEESPSAGDDISIVHGNEKIILVDDEETILDAGSKFLSANGYQVNCYSSPHKALEELKQQPDRYDLIITDMTMPKMTGTELAKQVFVIRPDMPIILCTGHSEQINKSQALSAGFRSYYEKPINLKNLLTAIRDVLDKEKSVTTTNLAS